MRSECRAPRHSGRPAPLRASVEMAQPRLGDTERMGKTSGGGLRANSQLRACDRVSGTHTPAGGRVRRVGLGHLMPRRRRGFNAPSAGTMQLQRPAQPVAVQPIPDRVRVNAQLAGHLGERPRPFGHAVRSGRLPQMKSPAVTSSDERIFGRGEPTCMGIAGAGHAVGVGSGVVVRLAAAIACALWNPRRASTRRCQAPCLEPPVMDLQQVGIRFYGANKPPTERFAYPLLRACGRIIWPGRVPPTSVCRRWNDQVVCRRVLTTALAL